MLDAVVEGDAEEGARTLAPLCALGPEVDTFAQVPAAEIAHLQLDPQEPTAVYANSVLVHGLPPDAVEALVATAGPGSGSKLLFVELASWVARWRGRPRVVVRSTTSTAPSLCSASGSTWAPDGAPCARTPPGSWTRSPPGPPTCRTSRWSTRHAATAWVVAERMHACSRSSAVDPDGLFVAPRAAAKRLIPRPTQVTRK